MRSSVLSDRLKGKKEFMSIQEKVKIICEEVYGETIWCKQLLGSVLKELKKRRISYEQSEIPKMLQPDTPVCILGVTGSWLSECVRKCNGSGCVPVILSSMEISLPDGQYHIVCPDMQGLGKNLERALEGSGRERTALYGASHLNEIDAERTAVFSKLLKNGEDVFHNTGNLENCFRSFLPKAESYDTVICCNGYTAISLVKRLEKENPRLLDQLLILSCEEVLKHSKYNQWISLLDMKLDTYGAVVMAVFDMPCTKGVSSAVTVKMRVELCEIPVQEGFINPEFEKRGMPEMDPEFLSMAKMEQLLRDADDMDHHIIAMLLDGATYGEIADSSYMTEGNVKYRVKKYMNICDCHTKKELLNLLQEYLQ